MDCKEIQSVLKEINPEYSLEGLMLKLKLQYFGHLMQRADSLEKTLTDSMHMSLRKLRETVMDREARILQFTGWQRARHDLATEQH